MENSNNNLKTKILANKGLIIIVIVVITLLIPSFFAPQLSAAVKKESVLSVASSSQHIQIPTPTTIPSPTLVPTATPTPIVTNTPTPTVVPTSTPTPTVTPTPTPNQTNPTPTPTSTPIPTATDTPTPTPSTAQLQVQIGIDYAGQKSKDSYTTSVNQGQTAWDAVVAAVGINNLQYTDYGGDMGIFINGFNGVTAASNQYFEFEINGISSNVGVSSYKCNDGDKLDFVLTSF